MSMHPLFRAKTKAHEKSVVLNGQSIWPLTPEVVAARLNELIPEIEDRAFAAGVAHAQAEIRKALGVPSR